MAAVAVTPEIVIDREEPSRRSARDGVHRDCVDRIVARDDEPNLAVAHHEMSTLSHDAVAEFLENPHGVPLMDARDARHSKS